jgi:hypothetical protein
MSKRMPAVGLLIAGAMALGADVAAGCGDKFILLGRGARVARSKFPSTILIYMNPSSRVPAADKEFRLEAVLRAAGHKARVAETDAEVQKALDQLARKELTRDQQRELLQRLVQLVVNKLLHQPTTVLRGADPAEAAALAAAVCELFDLEPQEQAEDAVAEPPTAEQSSERKAQA